MNGLSIDYIIIDEFANITDEMIKDATTKLILDNRTVVSK